TSSFTMHWALQSIKRDNHAGLQAGLLLTFLMGLTFLLTQVLEYSRIGFAPKDGAFATIFYCLTGLHGAHVAVGLLLLLAATVRATLVGGGWVGLAVFIRLSAAVLGWWVRARRTEQPVPTRPTRQSAPDERRILVVANETVGGRTLRDMIHEKSEGFREEVLVVTPALNAPLRHWASDEDGARAAAQKRLDASLARRREA